MPATNSTPVHQPGFIRIGYTAAGASVGVLPPPGNKNGLYGETENTFDNNSNPTEYTGTNPGNSPNNSANAVPVNENQRVEVQAGQFSNINGLGNNVSNLSAAALSAVNNSVVNTQQSQQSTPSNNNDPVLGTNFSTNGGAAQGGSGNTVQPNGI